MEPEELNRESEDFSFDCGESSTSAIAAEDAFLNGQIKPLFSLSPEDFPVKKIFKETHDDNSSESEDDEIAGPYCEWSGRKAVEASPDQVCKKSNSTGFSRIWRIKDQIVGRSSSDGKDAFVFLNNEEVKEKKRVKTTPVSAHEVYLRRRAKGEERRRSYLPYRPELVGFFTTINGGLLTKNVHPF